MDELWDALDRLRPRLKGIFDQVVADKIPERLCHYTDFHGLNGILQSQSFWATYARVLNDSTEQRYGERLLAKYARQKTDTPFWGLLRKGLLNPRRNFVTCFCDNNKSLSMWREYAKRGGGYCLEFDAPSLMGSAFPPHTVPLHLKMEYTSKIVGPMRAAVDTLCAIPDSLASAGVVGSYIGLLALKLKHPTFADEKEWRIVIQNPQLTLVEFRPGHSDIKPYIKIALAKEDGTPGRLPLRRVIVGPTLRHDRDLVEVIGMLLEKNGYTNVPVESSGIPYRL